MVGVFGASGFVGGWTVDRCQEEGLRVRRLSSPRTTGPVSPASVSRVIQAHPELVESVADALGECDSVVIATGAATSSSRDLTPLLHANAVSPGIIAAGARAARVRRCIYISSAAVQGDVAMLDASWAYRPFSPYAQSKVAGEQAVLEHGPDGTVLYRPPGVHGPDRRVTGSLARLAASPLSTVSRPGTARTPQALVHNVADAVRFMVAFQGPIPPVVIHPWEGQTVASVLEDLGGKRPHHLPVALARTALAAAKLTAVILPRFSPSVRRAELLWFGQDQDHSWLASEGWTPPRGKETWQLIGEEARYHNARPVLE